MSAGTGQSENHHLVLYDGECGFCSAWVQFILGRDKRGLFRFAALQSAATAAELKPFGGRPADLTTFYVIEDYRGARPKLHSRTDAVLLVAVALGWPCRLGGVFRVVPRAWRDAAYDLIARNRHRLPGAPPACLLPTPEQRKRFLDQAEGPAS